MSKVKSVIFFIFFICFFSGCVNYSQRIADDLACQCKHITTERSMIQQLGAPESVQHIGDMTIYKYKWSAGIFHGSYSSYEVYKSCEIIFQNKKMIDYRIHVQT